MGDEKKEMDFFSLENKSVEAIKDLKTLGVYTYMQMIIKHETTVLPILIERICIQFKMTESQGLEYLKILEAIGLIFTMKIKE